MNRREVLESAIEIVCNNREKEYGSPEDNFNIISDLWSSYKGVSFTAQDVAIMLALLKIGRMSSGQVKEDNYIDLAGYAACAGEIATRNKKNKSKSKRNLKFFGEIK